MTSYTVLTGDKTVPGSIHNLLNTSETNFPSAIALTLAQQEIYKKLRVREMLTLIGEVPGQPAGTLKMTIGEDFVPLPSDYRDFGDFWITGTDKAQLEHRIPTDVIRDYMWDIDGVRVNQKPQSVYETGTQLRFDKPADKEYPYLFLYYAEQAPLSPTNEINFLTNRYLRLIYSACAWVAHQDWLRDAEEAKEQRARTMEEIFSVNAESDKATTQHGFIRVHAS